MAKFDRDGANPSIGLVASNKSALDQSLAETMRRLGYSVRTIACDRLSGDGVGDADSLYVLPFTTPTRIVRRLSSRIARQSAPCILVTERSALAHLDRNISFSDLVIWPASAEELSFRIARLLSTRRTQQSAARSGRPAAIPSAIIGEAPSFVEMLKLLDRFARHDVPVLIEGETGTGKEMIARALHYLSERSGKPFIPVNCGALPDLLFENEMFGHEPGAFTDARQAGDGMVMLAESGTLFLDEIDALSPHGQVALLRFLQDKTYRPLGSRKQRQADIRILAATNAPVEALVADGHMRADLFYRLNTARLRIPPLRERPEDVVLLARHFLHALNTRADTSEKSFSSEALAWLATQGWPGNVRELQSCIERSFILAEGGTVAIDGGPSERNSHMSTRSFRDGKAHAVAVFERDYLTRVIAASRGNISEAARIAKKERRSFRRLLKKHGLSPSGVECTGSNE
jgi:two-component system, NtrC family, response regulator GlrR